MSRLPTPGADQGQWGNILNDYLSQAHDSEGLLIPSAVNDAIADGSITAQKLSSSVQATLTSADNFSGTVAGKADDSAAVHNTGDETVAGVKTFSSSPVVPAPTNVGDAVNKGYVDGLSGVVQTSSVPFSQSSIAALGASGSWRAPVAGTVSRVTLMTGTAPVGSALTVQFLINGSVVATQSISDGSTADATATASISFVAGDKLSVNATSVGSTTAATNVTAQFDYTYSA